MRKNLGFIVLIILFVVTSIFSINLYYREKTSSDKLDVRTFPYKIGDWNGKDFPVTEKEYDILETRNLFIREYSNPSGENIYLFIIYSETNRSVFHPPEVCLMGEGVDIVSRSTEKIGKGKYEFLANRLNLEKGKSKDMVLYCYKAGDLYTDNYYLQQAYFAIHQVFGTRVSGATIRVSMSSSGDEAKTLSELKSFLKSATSVLSKISS